MTTTTVSLSNIHPPPPPPTTSTSSQSLIPAKKLGFLIDKSKNINQILQIHAATLRHGHHQNPTLNFKLQRSYSSSLHRLHYLRYALALFDNTRDPDIYFWTNIIATDPTLNLYARMLANQLQPNAFTFSSVLKCCTLQSGKCMHAHVVQFGLQSDLYVGTGLVHAYARGGDVVSARKMFDSMPEKSLVCFTTMITCHAKHGHLRNARLLFDSMVDKDVVCWNVMIDAYTQNGKPSLALQLFQEMLSRKVKPNEVTVVSALSASGQLGAYESGRWIHSYIRNNGIRINVHVGTALVDMYSRCGNLDDARLVFDKINNKDVVAWNSMIVGYSMHGFSQDALKLFTEMCRMGTRPTNITFIGVLNACAHSGPISEGWNLFNSMKDDYKIQPKIEHYGCMVNLLGRAGRLKEAYELVKSMEIESDPVLWGTLLAACRLHCNVALGEEIAELLVSQNVANSGTYILLSNIYAMAGNWDGVARMRTMMKDNMVHKEPGCSSIEIQNKVHEFLAGDLRHPESKEIYRMLEEMNGWLRAESYTPRTDIVLLDVGETQKEQSLEVHSEKLALAFGLISTRPGSTIKIVKNLRVCLDCHAVTKLISKITGRTIVMRDRNRFHHFVNGSCSCGDYW